TRFSRDWSSDVCSSDLSFDEGEPLAFSDHSSVDMLVPPASTSPASIQDESDWKNADLEMITLSPKARSTQLPRPHNPSKPSSSEIGRASCREREKNSGL